MKIQVLYFQIVKRTTGTGQERVDLAEGSSVGDLVQALIAIHPGLEELAPSLLFAVNEQHSGPGRVLEGGDAVAVMPPFSGG